MAVRFLCIGDIHLGRRPTRLPSDLLEEGAAALGPLAAWRAAVDEAIDREVDAVLLAGDVVEQDDDFYEAFAPLEEGVRRLADKGIAVLAVAGNHDVAVLPRLAGVIDSFRLIGSGGRWEEAVVEGAGGQRVRVLGWSFPSPVVSVDPLVGLHAGGGDGFLATIGLLHCDRNATGSRYAPVRSGELDAAPVSAWLLGHIHAPDPLAGERPIGYLGSLCGLDPTETGPHGPWLVEVDAGGAVSASMLAMAPLRWESIEIDVSAMEDAAEFGSVLIDALRKLHERIMAETHARPRVVGCRVVLVGRSSVRAQIERACSAPEIGDLDFSPDGVRYVVDRITNEVLPALDLEKLAEGSDPVALLSRRLLLLERPAHDEERRRLISRVGARLAAVARKDVYAGLGGVDPLSEEETAALIRRVCLRALDELLSQKGERP